MAILKSDPSRCGAKPGNADQSPLALVVHEFRELVRGFETGLLRSLGDADDQSQHRRRDEIRREAYRLAIAELSTAYTRKQIRRSLHDFESIGKSAEEQLHAAANGSEADTGSSLAAIPNGHFRLYSTELFDMLGQPTDLRFGTLRFRTGSALALDELDIGSRPTSMELALSSSFFVAESNETLPYHRFTIPETPSLTNRGILSRKPEDSGAFPEYDSWLLFTFLGNGCLKVEVPIEMCADVYGGSLCGRENEEVTFWGIFVEDEAVG